MYSKSTCRVEEGIGSEFQHATLAWGIDEINNNLFLSPDRSTENIIASNGNQTSSRIGHVFLFFRFVYSISVATRDKYPP